MSKKAGLSYACTECGTLHSKWQGRCNGCGSWNTLVEEITGAVGNPKHAGRSSIKPMVANQPQLLSEVATETQPRLKLPDGELNRVLDGGLVPGSLILLGGEPGIGKSTLLLQLALRLKNIPVLYVTGEESAHQVKLRAERIPAENPALYLLAETNLEAILGHAESLQPTLLVIDSVQTLFLDALDAAPGSVSQVRECTARLMRLAKETGTSVILVGHVNKEGMIAGPKVLEHMVDVVLEFEGERNFNYRILRSTKNRFGATPELGIYDMRLEGLREVTNPSELFLSEHDHDLSGIATAATLQAQRPLLVETQALVSDAAYGNAQRSATGLDLRRLNMLLAVLEKKGGFKLGAKDVFVNLAGGIRLDDPALDLALAAAIVSSAYDIAIPPKTAFAAEIGLTGEIRGVSRIDARIAEARRMGFARIFISARQRDYTPPAHKAGDLEVILCGQLQEAFKGLFG